MKHTLLIPLLLLALQGWAQDELNGYLVTAAENNPGLKAKFNQYQAALQKVPQVGALPDPTVSFAYFIMPVETRVGPQRAKISAMQMFPWFGTLNAKEDVATALAKMKYEAFEEAKSKLFFDVKSAYFNIYFMQKAIGITNENITILNTLQQLALIKFEAAMASAVDELRVEMEIADLQNQLAYLNDNKFVLEIRFNNLLDVADDSPVAIPDSLWDDELPMGREVILDSIELQNHRLKQLEYKISSWQKQEAVAKKMGMPKFSVGVDYVMIGQSDNPMFDPGENGKDAFIFPKVGISIPIYRKKYSAMVKETALQMEAAQFEQTDKVNQLSSLFENSYKNHKDGNRRIDLYRGQLKLATKSLNILIAAYSTDGKNFEEVLRMERKILKYELELEKARTDKNAATAFIKYLTGK